MKLKRLADQVMVITGASSGIGMVTAEMAAASGARVVLAARSGGALKRITDKINIRGGEATYVVADVGKEEDVRKISDAAIDRFGGFDTWFNNAGISIYGRWEEVSTEDQHRLFETTYWGVVYGSRVAVQHLRDHGGALINMGSVASIRSVPLQSAYCAAKHAVKGYTDSLRMELEHDNVPVAVTLIKPGFIDTAFVRHARNYMPVKPKYGAPVYAPEAVAQAVLYAAQHPSRDLTVGGGGKLMSLFGALAPRSTDRLMEYTLFDAQQTDSPAGEPDSLYAPSHGAEKHSGYHHAFKRSLYTRAAEHKRVSAAALALGVGALAAGVLARRGSTPPRQRPPL